MDKLSRRDILRTATAGALSFLLQAKASDDASGPVIDIHQHTNYSGRPDDVLIAHQRTMGVTKTVLLPAGSKYGLDADAGGNDTVVARWPGASPRSSFSSPTNCPTFRRLGPCWRNT
jgi:hypothetical protein